MKPIRQFSGLVLLLCFVALYSCSKEEYFKSESGIKKQLEGSWSLIQFPGLIRIRTGHLTIMTK